MNDQPPRAPRPPQPPQRPEDKPDESVSGFDPIEQLSKLVADATAKAYPQLGDDTDPMVTQSKRADLGDFQSNAAMPLAKRLGKKPRDIAKAIVAHLPESDLIEPVSDDNIAGPGFVNFRLRAEALARLLEQLDSSDLGLPAPTHPKTIVVDVCGVNLAKQMHVGHLRATVIGDTLARVFERLGQTVYRQNHVGDWGLPIAMVTRMLLDESSAGRVDLDALNLDDLDRLYRLAQKRCAGQAKALAIVEKYALGPKIQAELSTEHEEAAEHLARAKETLVALQAKEPSVFAIWQRIYQVTMAACLDACATLCTHISETDNAGESSYSEELKDIVDDLISRGIAEESDGAIVVRLDDVGIKEPCIVRKSDGGYLYPTTDMAAIRRRVQKLHADRVIYTVDARQSLHFQQVFAAARKAGYTTKPGADTPSQLEHAAFGTVLGADGRPFKTRSGENVKLADLLDEAIERALKTVKEKDAQRAQQENRPPKTDAQCMKIARAVGITAIKYADLSSERIKDYVFDFDRMLTFEGNTGPYLLYALVRVRGIFRKAAQRNIALDYADAPFVLSEPAEKNLALELLRYPGAVKSVAASLEASKLCAYIYNLAGAFSSFFDACPVLACENESIRQSRLRLCALTGRVLADGLETLGMPTVDQM